MRGTALAQPSKAHSLEGKLDPSNRSQSATKTRPERPKSTVGAQRWGDWLPRVGAGAVPGAFSEKVMPKPSPEGLRQEKEDDRDVSGRVSPGEEEREIHGNERG